MPKTHSKASRSRLIVAVLSWFPQEYWEYWWTIFILGEVAVASSSLKSLSRGNESPSLGKGCRR